MRKLQSNRLHLVRHGENPANIEKVFSSKIVDHSLTDKGVLQAQQTAEWFISLEIEGDRWTRTVYSSPLKRASETAEIIASAMGFDVVVMENFREIDVGDLETRRATQADWEFHEEVLDDWHRGRSESSFPGGENYIDLWTRLKQGYVKITDGSRNKHVIVVSHGGIMSITMKDLCPDTDPEHFRDIKWDNCAIAEVDIEQSGDRIRGTLIKWNQHSHLTGYAAELVPGVPRYP